MITDEQIGNIIEAFIVEHGHVYDWDEAKLRLFAEIMAKEEREAVVGWLDEEYGVRVDPEYQ